MNQKTASSLQVVGYASFLQRFYAFVIDCLIFLPLHTWSQYNLITTKSIGIAIFVALVWCIYKPVMDWKFGGTIGKLVLKMRVLSTEGKAITFNQALLRFAPYFAISFGTVISTYSLLNLPGFDAVVDIETAKAFDGRAADGFGLQLTYFFYIFSISSIFLDPLKQAGHDKLANCCCMMVQPLSPEQQAADTAAAKEL